MTIVSTPSTNDLIGQAFEHYKATGEILDPVLVLFNQSGNWLYELYSHNDKEIGDLSHQVVPINRLVKSCPNGQQILLCTLIDNSKSPINLDYHHVKGYLEVMYTQHFKAPNLQTVMDHLDASDASIFDAPSLQLVRESLNASSAIDFDAPKLQTVIGDLNVESAMTFNAPNLETVGGYIIAHSAKTFNAPNLKTVGDDIDAHSAITFNAPNLEIVNGDLNAGSVTAFNAPKLVRVDGELILPSATMAAILSDCPAALTKASDGL